MKKISFTFAAATMIFAVGIGMSLLTSCEGPAGPAGQDANETCIQCHNDKVTVLAKMTQTANSGHQTGTTFERSTADCAPCHTHQGYLEVLATGEQTTAEDVSNPVPANCRTCHMIHENYDSTDFALRGQSPVAMLINGVDVDLGHSNVCVSCHQPRIPDPMPTLDGGNVTLTSNRWGPHHGTQSAVVWGTGGYEVSGTVSYPQAGSGAVHSGAGCVKCHMAEPFGAFAGGHTFGLSYDYHGSEVDLVAGCNTCHSNVEDFSYDGVQTQDSTLLANLKTNLVDAGILNAGSGLVNASSSKPLTISSDQAGALLNYYLIMEDRSMGIHNPAYAKALLQNSIEVFN
ncbi:MAG TPA: hypothetical protein VE870_15895 [Bacteroidales bacterium]|nr:hypothetical protein [Bacteroidales bacterium]